MHYIHSIKCFDTFFYLIFFKGHKIKTFKAVYHWYTMIFVKMLNLINFCLFRESIIMYSMCKESMWCFDGNTTWHFRVIKLENGLNPYQTNLDTNVTFKTILQLFSKLDFLLSWTLLFVIDSLNYPNLTAQ